MAVTVRLFAALRDAAGTAEVEVAPGTVPTIVEDLSGRFGEPFASRVVLASGMLDGRRVALDEPIDVADGAELALLPPFSGGAAVGARQRRSHLLLLGGSVLVPVVLVLGVLGPRWAFALAVLVVGAGTAFDLHTALGATGVRPVLPATLVLGVGPPLVATIVAAPDLDAVGGLLAVAVMLSFLLAYASPRRHETAAIVGATMAAGLLVAVGTTSLVLLFDTLAQVALIGALLVIAVTDAATVLAGARGGAAGSRRQALVAVGVAAVAAGVLYVVRPDGADPPALALGAGIAAVVGALLGARLHRALRGEVGDGTRQRGGDRDGAAPTAAPPPTARPPADALLVGTADASLLGAAVVLLWVVAFSA